MVTIQYILYMTINPSLLKAELGLAVQTSPGSWLGVRAVGLTPDLLNQELRVNSSLGDVYAHLI